MPMRKHLIGMTTFAKIHIVYIAFFSSSSFLLYTTRHKCEDHSPSVKMQLMSAAESAIRRGNFPFCRVRATHACKQERKENNERNETNQSERMARTHESATVQSMPRRKCTPQSFRLKNGHCSGGVCTGLLLRTVLCFAY